MLYNMQFSLSYHNGSQPTTYHDTDIFTEDILIFDCKISTGVNKILFEGRGMVYVASLSHCCTVT